MDIEKSVIALQYDYLKEKTYTTAWLHETIYISSHRSSRWCWMTFILHWVLKFFLSYNMQDLLTMFVIGLLLLLLLVVLPVLQIGMTIWILKSIFL